MRMRRSITSNVLVQRYAFSSETTKPILYIIALALAGTGIVQRQLHQLPMLEYERYGKYLFTT